MEKELMAYLAGIIDGDGSLSIIREKRGDSFSFYPCIQVSNVFEGMIQLFKEKFGGTFKKKTKQPHQKKDQFVWCVRGLDSCKSVIEKLRPYLVLKAKQSDLMLEFISTKGTNDDIIRSKMQLLNNECLVAHGNVAKQANKNSSESTFWAYFAGILDTEGSFSVRKNKPSWGCVNFKYNPMVQISMASFEAMNFLRKNLAIGRICFPKAKTTQRGHTYRLYFGKISECICMLKSVLPFLKFKYEPAKILLDFCENYSPVAHKHERIPEEILEFRENCHQKIKLLNEGEVYKSSLIDLEG